MPKTGCGCEYSAFGREQSFVEICIPQLCGDHLRHDDADLTTSTAMESHQIRSSGRYTVPREKPLRTTLLGPVRGQLSLRSSISRICIDDTIDIMTSLCECSTQTHTHPDADVLQAAFDSTRFQHIWRPIHRSCDLFLLSTNERESYDFQRQFFLDPIFPFCRILFLFSALSNNLHHLFAFEENKREIEKGISHS